MKEQWLRYCECLADNARWCTSPRLVSGVTIASSSSSAYMNVHQLASLEDNSVFLASYATWRSMLTDDRSAPDIFSGDQVGAKGPQEDIWAFHTAPTAPSTPPSRFSRCNLGCNPVYHFLRLRGFASVSCDNPRQCWACTSRCGLSIQHCIPRNALLQLLW